MVGWLVGREFVRFDIHLEIQFNFPVAIPLSRASQRVENRESRDEGEDGWRGRKIGKRATGCSARCSIENHRQPPPIPTIPRLCYPHFLSLFLSLSRPLFHLPPSFSPHHLEEEIKRTGAQRQTLIPPTPADALLPSPFPRRCATRFQTPIHTIPLDTLAMAEGTTPSRETLLSREVWGGAGRIGGWAVG